MQSHIGCICLTFLRCAFWNVSSKRLPEKRQSHIGCICLTFLHFDFSNVSSNCLHEKLHNHIVCFKTKVFNVCIGKAWAWAIMCIFKLCPLEDGLAHVWHDESLPSAIVTMWTFKLFRHEKTFAQHMHLSALSAEIRPLPTVSFHVHFQVVSTGKRFST